jgi:hypothetical protein
MKFFKWFLLSVFILILLAAGSVFVLITFYKKELTSLLIENLKTKYGLTLTVSDIKVSFIHNWPQASVELENVSLSSTNDNPKGVPFLLAESISLSFNLEKMIHKQFVVKNISIRNGEVKLVKNEDGTNNFKFHKNASDTTERPSEPVGQVGPALPSGAEITFEINKINIKNTQFNYIHSGKGQNIDILFKDNDIRLTHYEDGIRAKLKGEIFIDGLLFNVKHGEFLDDTEARLSLQVTYFKDSKTLCIEPSSFTKIKDHRYELVSLIDPVNKKLQLIIETKDLDFKEVSGFLTNKIKGVLSNFEVKKPLDAKVLLSVNIGKREDPILIVDVEGRGNDLTIGNSKIPYSNIWFKGKIVSLDSSLQRGRIEKAKVVFEPVKGNVYDFPFTASVSVVNLTNPSININARLNIDASKIKSEIAQDFNLKGSAVADIKYSGPTEKLNKQEFLDKPMRLDALLSVNNLVYQEKDRWYTYAVNGKATLNNRDLQFENLNIRTDVGDAVIKGKAENFVNYVLGYTHGFTASFAARTEKLDLNPILKKQDESKESVASNTAKNEVSGKTDDKPRKLTKKMRQSKFDINVNLFAKRFLIRKVEASNAHADLHYKNNYLTIKSIVVNTCDGKISAKGTIEDFNKIDATVSVQNVNVKKMFDQFENFGQQAITSDNLQGDIFVEAKFQTELDDKMEVIGETMYSDVKLKLKDGHLINYEPVQNLSNFLFRNRDFNDVTFSELNETFKIRGYSMEIQELEIGSNVLNLYVVNGIYNFRGNSNVNILIPWSNLKKRGKNYIPKSTGESAENTKGVKLNFSGPSKNMKISFGHKVI